MTVHPHSLSNSHFVINSALSPVLSLFKNKNLNNSRKTLSDKKDKNRSTSPRQPPPWLRELFDRNAFCASHVSINITHQAASSRTRSAPVATSTRRVMNTNPRIVKNMPRDRINSVRDSAVQFNLTNIPNTCCQFSTMRICGTNQSAR